MATRLRKRNPSRQSLASATSQAQNLHYTCRDCANSYDWNSKALDGHLILCRCKYDAESEFGKWCKLLRDPSCSHFRPRT